MSTPRTICSVQAVLGDVGAPPLELWMIACRRPIWLSIPMTGVTAPTMARIPNVSGAKMRGQDQASDHSQHQRREVTNERPSTRMKRALPERSGLGLFRFWRVVHHDIKVVSAEVASYRSNGQRDLEFVLADVGSGLPTRLELNSRSTHEAGNPIG